MCSWVGTQLREKAGPSSRSSVLCLAPGGAQPLLVASSCMISCYPHLPELPSSHSLRLLQSCLPLPWAPLPPQATSGFLFCDLAEASTLCPVSRMIFPWGLHAATFSTGLSESSFLESSPYSSSWPFCACDFQGSEHSSLVSLLGPYHPSHL